MNRQLYPEPTPLENAENQINHIIITHAREQGRTAPSTGDIRQAFEMLGDWYTAAPPSDDRDARALELARVLIFDHESFIGELLDTAGEDSEGFQTALAMLQAGKTPGEILSIMTGVQL